MRWSPNSGGGEEKSVQTDWDKLRPVLLESIGTTIYLVAVTFVVAGLIGLSLGTALYTTRRGGLLANAPIHLLLNVVVNIVRPIPFIILLAALGPITLNVVGTTIGTEAALFVMIVAASFGIARIVEQNLVTVDPGVIEAARAMGAGLLRVILTVLIPEALGPLVLGYTFVVIAIVDMSAMAGTVGGGGLGDFALVYGYQRFDWEVTLVATLLIIAGVQAIQFLGNRIARKVLRR
ncbi:methionine ABC transporter permease [Nocardia brevicatena]|uniref:methionine ABC transporter permease n=1 Tax=Nocardia brevicatena TaxID=37327 RepID=UPI00031092D2